MVTHLKEIDNDGQHPIWMVETVSVGRPSRSYRRVWSVPFRRYGTDSVPTRSGRYPGTSKTAKNGRYRYQPNGRSPSQIRTIPGGIPGQQLLLLLPPASRVAKNPWIWPRILFFLVFGFFWVFCSGSGRLSKWTRPAHAGFWPGPARPGPARPGPDRTGQPGATGPGRL